MINTNLSIMDAGNNFYSDGFGGSAYEHLVAHDNVTSEYIEDDEQYISIPYHAIDVVRIEKEYYDFVNSDTVCHDGRFCEESLLYIEESATGTKLHDGDTIQLQGTRYYFFYPIVANEEHPIYVDFTATVSDTSLTEIVSITENCLEIHMKGVAGSGDIVFSFPEQDCSWTIHFTATP